MKIAVITDSSSNLSLDYIKSNPNLAMTPLMISFEDAFYRDLVEVDYKTVYEKLMVTSVTTSLPSLEDFDQAVMKFQKEGYTDILVITISSGLSGTFNGFNTAAGEYTDINIHMYDSKTLSMALGYIVKEAIDLIKKDLPLPQIIKKLNKLRYEESLALFTVETLKWLKKGGRIGKVEGTIGELLHVKPVITVNDDGVYVTLSKGFGMSRTLIALRQALRDKFSQELIDVTIHYGDNLEKANSLKAKIEAEFNINTIDVVQLTPVLGIHTGPEMYALIAKKVHK
ncbi:MAG: DegV family protein [Bacilli bacterium]|nr:DegV family protein [Bacilli bacterium]